MGLGYQRLCGGQIQRRQRNLQFCGESEAGVIQFAELSPGPAAVRWMATRRSFAPDLRRSTRPRVSRRFSKGESVPESRPSSCPVP